MADNLIDDVPTFASMVGGLLGYEGNQINAASARQAGQSAQTAAAYNAAQARTAAGQAMASGEVGAAEEMRQALFVNSTALARAAASGAGASDPTVINIMANTQGRGSYLAGLKMYSAEEQSRQLMDKANADIYEGDVTQQADNTRAKMYGLSADTALLKGVSPLAARYAYEKPPS